MGQSLVKELELITDKLKQKETLTGKHLEVALEVLDEGKKGFSDENFLDNISRKLVSGHSLNDYELSTLVDVLFLHKILSE